MKGVMVSTSLSPSTTTTIALGQTLEGAIASAYDVGLIRVELRAGEIYAFDMLGAASGLTLDDPTLTLLNANLEAVAFDDDSGLDLNARISLIAPSTGTYYLQAASFGDGKGTYRLTMMSVSDDWGALPSKAGHLTIGGSAAGAIDFIGDRDWFSVSLTANTTYEFMLRGVAQGYGALRDPSLGLFDQNGTLIGSNDDGDEDSLNSLLSFTPSVSGTYYLEAVAFDNRIGSYQLSAVVDNDSISDPLLGHVRSDFNGDGRSDIAWVHSSGAFTSWVGQPDGTFANTGGAGANPVGTDWRIVGIGDFNGDGVDDLLWRHAYGEIGQWQGQSTGTFANTSDVAANAVDNDWNVVGVADYNGDGRDDILWRHNSGAITEWLAQIDGAFTNNSAAAANVVDTSWTVVASGNFNADGYADVLWQHSSGAFVEWRGTATGALENIGQVMAGAGGTVIGSADFNGDGRDDILTRASDGTITEWLARPSGQFSSVTPKLQVEDLNWEVVGLGDYNGDGFDDLLWRHTSGELSEWLGAAGGQFSYGNIIPLVDSSWQTQSPDLVII